ncbi:MAG: phage tail tape measure protein [Pseudomonas sp.]|uniref:phage tail tape measure protein n=1 Tax=Pseudomonas sp. TaxID=306 RepID=UPI0032428619
MARDLKLQLVLSTIDKVTKPLKAITGRNKEAAAAFKATRDQIKQLHKQQSDIRSYRQANIESVKQARALRDLATKSRGYTQALEDQRRVHTNLRSNLKSAQTQYNKLAKALIDGKGNTAEFQRELEKANIRLTSARQAFERSSSSIRTYQTRIRNAGRETDNLTKAQRGTQDRLTTLKTKLDAAGVGTEGLGAKSRRLRTDQERLNTTLKQQEDALKRVAQQQARMARARNSYDRANQLRGNLAGAGARGMAVGGASIYGAARLLAPGIEYGAQMSELQAIARLSKDDPRFQMLKDQARGLGASTAFSASEVGAGQTFLARAGFTPEAISASMADILNLALANKTDLARTADIASNISSAFKIDPEVEGNITRVADVLSGTASRANVDLEMLGDTMKYLGGKSDLGLTLEQAATMAGLLGNIGIQGSQAGTTTRGLINRLTAPAKAGREAMEELGLQVADAEGNMRELPSILRDINNATRDMGNVQRQDILTRIFGVEAGSGSAELVSLMSDGGLDRLLDQLHNVQGENARMAATLADNAGGDLKGLNSAWQEIGISLTDTNDGPLRELIQSLTSVLRSVGDWIKENPKLVGRLATAAAVIAGLVAVGGSLLVVLSSIIGPLALLRYGMTLFGVAAGTSLAPVLLVIGAIALLAAGAYLIYKHWDKIVPYFKGLWAEIKAGFNGGFAGIAELIVNFSPVGLFYRAFSAVMRYFGVEMPERFTDYGRQMLAGLVNGITNGLGAVKSAITGAGEQMVGWFKDKLGIHSPSRVFASLGDDTMAGLQRGLQRSQGGPLSAVLGAGQAMVKAGALALGIGGAGQAVAIDSRPPISAAGGPSVVVQGDTLHIQLSAPAGADLAQIEQLFNRLLDQRERHKAARVRSALSDYD